MSITARESRFGLDFLWNENDIRTDARLRVRLLRARRFAGEPQLAGEQGRADAPARVREAHEGALVAARRADERHHLASRPQDGELHRSAGIRATSATAGRSSGSRPGRTCPITAKVSAAAGVFRTLGGDLDGDKVDDGADSGRADLPGTGSRCRRRSARRARWSSASRGTTARRSTEAAGDVARASNRGPGTSTSESRPAIAGSSWASSSSAITSAPITAASGRR